MKLHRLFLAALLLVVPADYLEAQTPRYVVIDLDPLGGTSSSGNGINNAGQVAGNRAGQAVLFSVGSAPQDLGGTDSYAYAINDAGQMAGRSRFNIGGPPGYQYHAALIRVGSAPQDLGTIQLEPFYPLSFWWSYGTGINNAGLVAGVLSFFTGHPRHAALFRVGSAPQDLGGGYCSGINNAGQVVGVSEIAGTSAYHAALFRAGSAPQDLGTLGGASSSGIGINNAGQVAGSSELAGTANPHAFIFLNDASESTPGFNAAKSLKDLNNMINTDAPSWVLSDAYAINDAGQVAGTGTNAGGSRHAYLATPFWRQADCLQAGAKAVPATFGYGDSMKDHGCALCAAASMARSVIALNSKPTVLPVITPAFLNSRLLSPGPLPGYDGDSKLYFQNLPAFLKRYADIVLTGIIPVTAANLSATLTEQIYTNGYRVILKFSQTAVSTTGTNTGTHFVWVVGKEGTDWKVGDGAWNNVTPVITGSVFTIESLNAHIAGFQTTTNGNTTTRTFTPVQLYVYRNLKYTVPPNIAALTAAIAPAGSTSSNAAGDKAAAVPSAANAGPLDGTTAAVSAVAVGPVELVITDPQGRRLGHDQATGNEYAEIPNGSYWTEDPILTTSDDDPTETHGVTSKNLNVPSPLYGTYTVVSTGTATGTASVMLNFIGPGGAPKTVLAGFDTTAGQTNTQQITVPSIGTADLSATQSVSPASAHIGTPLTYTLAVTNNGPSTAAVPTFTDLLPNNVNFVSATSSSGTCGLSGNVVGGVLDDLPPGATATVTITVLPTTAGSLSNSAYAAGFETDPDETNNASVMTTAVATSFDDWRNLHFTTQELGDPAICGLTADPDKDGVRNLIEYALGLDPKACDVSALPPATKLSVSGTNYLAYTYTIPPGVTDVAYSVEASIDLTTWSTAGLQMSTVNNADGTQTVTVTDSTPMNQTTRKFMRLRVTK